MAETSESSPLIFKWIRNMVKKNCLRVTSKSLGNSDK